MNLPAIEAIKYANTPVTVLSYYYFVMLVALFVAAGWISRLKDPREEPKHSFLC